MDLSIIIATYNNAKSLERTLLSVAKQDADSGIWECVIVNNNSTDDTALRVSEFTKECSNLNIRLVDEPQQGLSHARNRGVAEAKGDILVFIDDDETINEGFVSAYIDLFHNQGAFAASGVVEVCYDSRRPKWMSHYTEKMIGNPFNLGDSVTSIISSVTPAGGNMAFNREVFNLYGGFDANLGRRGNELFGGEENEFFDRLRNLGERVFYTPKAIVYHHIADRKLTPEYFDKLSYGVGASKLLRAEKYGTEQALYRDERAKRCYTYILALFYTLTFRPQKAKWLIRMRNGISKGIFRS